MLGELRRSISKQYGPAEEDFFKKTACPQSLAQFQTSPVRNSDLPALRSFLRTNSGIGHIHLLSFLSVNGDCCKTVAVSYFFYLLVTTAIQACQGANRRDWVRLSRKILRSIHWRSAPYNDRFSIQRHRSVLRRFDGRCPLPSVGQLPHWLARQVRL